MTDSSPRPYSRSVPRFTQYDCDVRANAAEDLAKFVRISVELTGFSEAELAATGMTAALFEELGLAVSLPVCTAFLNAGLTPAAMMDSDVHSR